ncbi:RNA polymerase sigma factor [Pedococcus sp. 5OH_020]|uniref:RNA polymerase sigma factor n=1 Tax=Pedococcus sp. 5OH_020 TaxID=2989814 RepID=UPI0022E9C981|nr:sigma-70 family RNA polymerase sigma factor [Pedococcus sp. 5OH_020]
MLPSGDDGDGDGDRGDPVDRRPDSARLLEAARAGDQAAFAALYEQHAPAVRGYARRLAQFHTAEDLVADAFTRTWEQLRAGRGPHTEVAAYLRAVVRNLHLTRLRRDRIHLWVADVQDAALSHPCYAARVAQGSPEDLVLDELVQDRLRSAMSALPEHWQHVLLLVYFDGRPYEDVASHLGVTVPAARQLARRARLALRRALSSQSTHGRPHTF